MQLPVNKLIKSGSALSSFTFWSFEENFKEDDLGVKVNEQSQISEFNEIPPLALEDVDNFGSDSNPADLINKNSDMDENHHNFDNNFEEIPPLHSSFDFDSKNQKFCESMMLCLF